MTRARVHAIFRGRHSTRGRRDIDYLCTYPHGLRAGYRAGRIMLLLTSDAAFSVRGVRAGETLAAARGSLGSLSGPYRVGANDWHLSLRRHAGARVVLKVRGGSLREIGLAAARLTNGPPADRAFLSGFR